MVEISGTWNPPSKGKLWLAEVIGVNRQKFCGKRGNILKEQQHNYYRAQDYASKNKYIIASINETLEKDANVTVKKIKEFSITEDDVYFMFRFFGNEYSAENLEGVREKLVNELELCKKKIEESKKAEINLRKLMEELDTYLKNLKIGGKENG